MRRKLWVVSFALVVLLGCLDARESGRQESLRCRGAEVALQVLGSGGPIPDDDRASSGYLIWIQGKARALIDLGGGVMLRFGQSGASIEDLDILAVTHLHVDHVGDLSAFLKGGYFTKRQETLPFFGPDGNERFPATDVFLRALLEPKDGAFRYLSPYLTGESAYFKVEAKNISATTKQPVQVFSNERLTLDAVGIRHGTVPSVGYLAKIGGLKIAFMGDQSAESTEFVQMAKGADILVAHHVIPETLPELQNLHRLPSQLGDLAASAQVKQMVLSHNMKRSLEKLDESLKLIQERYSGKVDVANDLSCYVLK